MEGSPWQEESQKFKEYITEKCNFNFKSSFQDPFTKNSPMQLLNKFEKFVFYFLTTILVFYIALQMVELGYMLVMTIKKGAGEGHLVFSKENNQELLPIFFSILIAIEMIDTFSVYVHEHSIKVLNILLIGLMAIGRKLLTLDFAHAEGIENLGLGALILSLSLGYYLIKRSGGDAQKEEGTRPKFPLP
jgi:uncharacterized membrane protein (DUF373 family)